MEVQNPQAMNGFDMGAFGNILAQLIGAQGANQMNLVNALQRPQSKIVRKDMSGNVIDPNTATSGLDKNFAMNPGAGVGISYDQRQQQAQQQALLNQLGMQTQIMQGRSALADAILDLENKQGNAGVNPQTYSKLNIPLNPFIR